MERREFVKNAGYGTLGLGIGKGAMQAPVQVSKTANCMITLMNTDPVVGFAGHELARYLNMASFPGRTMVSVQLGLFQDFSVPVPVSVKEIELDDAVDVNIRNGKGYIAGVNGRSALLAVYRFLNSLGFEWIRPGRLGEIIPRQLPSTINARISEVAASRHRNICIEGAVSLTNVQETIDWMPKVGFNSFMMQFREGYTFFDRWYTRDHDPSRKRLERLDRDMAREFTALIENEVRGRGLFYHAVGHGWHLEAFNVPGTGWDASWNLPDEFMNNVAIFNGKRWVPWDVPMLTALCYSDPFVQGKMVKCIADYADKNPVVDYLHVWLDDFTNNKCECDRCRSKRPSDWYFQILNALDKELSARSNNVKIVFLSYCDLLFPPLSEKLVNEKRFVFMYANRRGDYNMTLSSSVPAVIPDFRYNDNDLGKLSEPATSVAILKLWKNLFRGDSFIYEYYLENPDTLQLSATIASDMTLFREYGLNGVSSCQTLRSYFPCGLSMYIMSQALWNEKLDFDRSASAFFMKAYGNDGKKYHEFLLHVEKETGDILKSRHADLSVAAEKAALLKSYIAGFMPVIDRNAASDNAVIALSWQLAATHATIVDYFTDFIKARLSKNTTMQHYYNHNALVYARRSEEKIQPYAHPTRLYSQLFGN
jgi:hypothetical protein